MIRLMLAAGSAVLLLAGCTQHSAKRVDPESDAMKLCRTALSGAKVASATLTTVREVRALRGGPTVLLAPSALPGAAVNAQAAWCWVSNGSGSWASYAVSKGNVPVRTATIGGTTLAPSGAPRIP